MWVHAVRMAWMATKLCQTAMRSEAKGLLHLKGTRRPIEKRYGNKPPALRMHSPITCIKPKSMSGY